MDRSDPQDLSPGNSPAKVGSCLIDSFFARTEDALFYSVKSERGPERIVKLYLKRSRSEAFSVNAETLLKLRHQNLTRVFSAGLHKGYPYVEMEKVKGTSLEQVFDQRGALPLEVCTSVGIIICKALEYLHHYRQKNGTDGIVHMNIRPSRIFLCDTEGLKLLGTGEQVFFSRSGEEIEESERYSAPEVIRKKEADRRSDIYSLGCVLYQMICGERVFPQTSVLKLSNARKHNRFVPLSNYRLRVPRELRGLVERCLEDKPSKRPRDISVVLEKLKKIHDSLSRHSPQDVIDYLLNATEGRIVIGRRIPKAVPLGVVAGLAVLFVIWKTGPEAFFERSAFLKGMLMNFLDQRGEVLFFRDAVPESPYSASKPESSDAEGFTFKAEPKRNRESEETKKSEEQGTEQKVIPEENEQTSDTGISVADTHKSEVKDTGLARSGQKRRESSGIMFKFESFSERLRRLHQKSDLLNFYKTEMSQGRYEKGLIVYEFLSSQQKQDAEVRLLRMRALVVLRRTNELEAFFNKEPEISDKEYYFAKGQFFYEKKRYESALKSMKKCRSSVSNFSDPHELDKRAAYYTASCHTIFFERNPVEKLRKQALDSWFDVKYLYRNDRSHHNFTRAEEEIRRLSNINTD